MREKTLKECLIKTFRQKYFNFVLSVQEKQKYKILNVTTTPNKFVNNILQLVDQESPIDHHYQSQVLNENHLNSGNHGQIKKDKARSKLEKEK